MTNVLFLIVTVLILVGCASQKHEFHPRLDFYGTYMPISIYREMGERITQANSDNIVITAKDTFILIPNKDPFKGMKRVPFELKDSTFIDIYKNVVYGTHNENLKPERRNMKYWKDTISMYFDPSVEFPIKDSLFAFAKKIDLQVDSLFIKKEDANYIVYSLYNDQSYDYEPKNTGSEGYYVNWNTNTFTIYKGSLKIYGSSALSQSDKIENSKYHLFLSLGYFYDTKQLPCESYFSTCPVSRTLSSKDIELIQYHYSYGKCMGQDLETFETQQRKMRKAKNKHPDGKLFVIHP